MIDAGQQRAEMLAVGDDAADRNAAEADAVIATLAADQPGAGGLATDIMIGERDLERGVDCFRAGVAEEHTVEIGGRQRRDPARQLERFRVRELERWRVIEFLGLALDRFDDRRAVMAGIGAPQPRGAVEHGAIFGGVIMHVLGARDQPRRALERPVRRERNPKGFEIVRHGRAAAIGLCHGNASWRHFLTATWKTWMTGTSPAMTKSSRIAAVESRLLTPADGRQIGKIQQAQGAAAARAR